MHADTDDDAFPAIIVGDSSEIETVALEILSSTDLSGVSVKVTAVGY